VENIGKNIGTQNSGFCEPNADLDVTAMVCTQLIEHAHIQ